MRVECIKSFDEIRAWRINHSKGTLAHEIYPEVGGIYTVRRVVDVELPFNQGFMKGYLLNEIRNEIALYYNGPNELCFMVEHFRPVTDISELQKLTKVRELEGV